MEFLDNFEHCTTIYLYLNICMQPNKICYVIIKNLMNKTDTS